MSHTEVKVVKRAVQSLEAPDTLSKRVLIGRKSPSLEQAIIFSVFPWLLSNLFVPSLCELKIMLAHEIIAVF